MNKIVMLMLVLIFAVEGCKKPYSPPIVSADGSYLVVEGIINSGADSTYIKLSRTVKLSASDTPKLVLGAIVRVESDGNSTYILNDIGNGVYACAPLNLSYNSKYRLRIKTADNREYLSDYIQAKKTPVIDSISFKIQNNGLQFYVNTHDQQNSTIYYRWDFSETWKYVSYIQSFYKLDSTGYPVFRVNYRTTDNIYECYKSLQSHQVLLASSAKLGKDVIYMYPINFVDASTGKLPFGYTFLLKEYALTPDAFAYWQNLKKNTEQLGSVFDAQPTSLPSNIHCISNPSEPVIGYLSVSSVTSLRKFVDHYYDYKDLYSPAYFPPPDAGACPTPLINVDPAESFHYRLSQALGSGDSTIIKPKFVLGDNAPVIVAYYYAPTDCVDCRRRAPFGTTTIPVYWPYQ
jgi:hypothetical protein